MMKCILVLGLTFSAANALAGWAETVKCTVTRGSIDDLQATIGSTTKELVMDGAHNSEVGKVEISHPLIPSYKVTYLKTASGRNDEVILKTTVGGKTVALTSIDVQQNPSATNKFVSEDGLYQITVSCSSSLKR